MGQWAGLPDVWAHALRDFLRGVGERVKRKVK